MKKVKVQDLRIGRVYHIFPGIIEGYGYTNKKGREALYVGKVKVNEKYRRLFIQMGSSPYYQSKEFSDFMPKMEKFWKFMGRDGHFHYGSSKPETFRFVNEYKRSGSYVDVSKATAEEMREKQIQLIEKMEERRLNKAWGNFLIGKKTEAFKQLHLLKSTQPWKHHSLEPDKVLEKWKIKKMQHTKKIVAEF